MRFLLAVMSLLAGATLLWGCTPDAELEQSPEQNSEIRTMVTPPTWRKSLMFPINSGSNLTHMVIPETATCEGILPAYDSEKLPTVAMIQDGETVTVLGEAYTVFKKPVEIESFGWRLRLDTLTPIAVTEKSQVIFASDTLERLFLYVLDTSSKQETWLVKQGSNLSDRERLYGESVKLYVDGSLCTDDKLKREILERHEQILHGKSEEMFFGVLDGDWRGYTLDFIDEQCLPLIYRVNVGVVGDEAYMKNVEGYDIKVSTDLLKALLKVLK